MTENEKEIYFAGEKPEDTNYEVIEILQPRLAPLTRVRRSVEFSSHGEDFKLEMKPNTKLLAPYVRLQLNTNCPSPDQSVFQAMIVKRSSSEDLERLENEEDFLTKYKNDLTAIFLLSTLF